jgi:folate-binding protein YgfZ
LALEGRSVVAVRGEDAHEWLQGQLTNQCDGTKPGDAVYGFILTLKGRVMADAWALFDEDGVWLDVPEDDVDALIERLDRYIIMEDVELERRDDLRWLAAVGPRARDVEDGGWSVDRLGFGGVQWRVPAADLPERLERATDSAAAAGGGRVSPEAWALAHLAEGRPRFGVDFGPWTYPQESGLTTLAVSFNKGCYVGQETVVMLENRGRAPKALWRWQVESPEPPAPGSPILRAGTPVGEVTSAARVEGRTLALGFLKRGHDDGLEDLEILGHSARPLGPVAEALTPEPDA